MSVVFHEKSGEFHLFNDEISYIISILPNGQLGQLYYGKRLRDRESFEHLQEYGMRSMVAWVGGLGRRDVSLELLKQEYPSFGSSDFRNPAFEILQENGSHVSNFRYVSHEIISGKPGLSGLPATYTEAPEEADTIVFTLFDEVTQVELKLNYTVFRDYNAIARSAHFENKGSQTLKLNSAMSFSLDLPGTEYEWMQFSGAWAREREPFVKKIGSGVTSVESMRGCSSPNQNPFVVIRKPGTTEDCGEAYGVSLVYSGNFLAQAEGDTYGQTRVMIGINPRGFCWNLTPGEVFQTPEAVVVYSAQGLNGMSQNFHELYRTRLARGYWRDRERPVLLNNWEATYMDFDEEKILNIARKACEAGIELFVLDDGWFGKRNDDFRGLGDWFVNTDKLENGISGLSRKITEMGMRFGLWFEPEMVNEDSDLFRAHPDWILATPGREPSLGRNQCVLDFSRKVVVDAIYEMMEKVIADSDITYIKWDMNRSITECYSAAYAANQQGEIYHRYILGVYDLYERLITRFPEILFESCASGGARFDPGMLYYAPQAWCSDDTDAVERIGIQYGTSYCYPVSSVGAHVSVVPNHQILRETPLETRFNVAMFGAFGYELDITRMPEEEFEEVKKQVAFVKQYRKLIHTGTYYRLADPFATNEGAWMVVSQDQKEAIVMYSRILIHPNSPVKRLKLKGLNPDLEYRIEAPRKKEVSRCGDELMYAGLITTEPAIGDIGEAGADVYTDFYSKVYVLKAN